MNSLITMDIIKNLEGTKIKFKIKAFNIDFKKNYEYILLNFFGGLIFERILKF